MDFGFTIDESDIKNDFNNLPAGDYIFALTGYEEKTSSTGFPYVNFTAEVMEGDFKGRKVFINNLWSNHSNPTTLGIAKSEKTKIALAIGLNAGSSVKGPSDFLRLLFIGNVGLKKKIKQIKCSDGKYVDELDSNGNIIYDEINYIKKYYKKGEKDRNTMVTPGRADNKPATAGLMPSFMNDDIPF